MTYSFNPAIPQPNDAPSDSQPDILTNFASINSIVAVDHIGFNTSGGGTHTQMRINTPLGSDPARTTTQGSYYTKSGTATSAIANAYFNTGVGVYNLNLIKAYGILLNGVFQGSQQMNCTASYSGTTGVTTVTVTSGIITGTNFSVILSNGTSAIISGVGVFTFNFSGGVSVGFIVLQL